MEAAQGGNRSRQGKVGGSGVPETATEQRTAPLAGEQKPRGGERAMNKVTDQRDRDGTGWWQRE